MQKEINVKGTGQVEENMSSLALPLLQTYPRTERPSVIADLSTTLRVRLLLGRGWKGKLHFLCFSL
jgi:hypothetical protein